MGSTSQAQPASMRRCPGAAGPQYSMYPVDIRCAQPTGEQGNSITLRLQSCSSLTPAQPEMCAVPCSLVRCAADTFLWRTFVPQSVSHAK